jgi:Spy/CpxP family protein refolding chaperone
MSISSGGRSWKIWRHSLPLWKAFSHWRIKVEEEHLKMWKLFAVFVVLMLVPTLSPAQSGHSPYTGQEQRAIKALSDDEVQALLNGQGMGLAKVAELNHYPGPRHVLDMATQLGLSDTQRAETQQIYDRMHQEAVRLGNLLIAKERELDRLFATNEIDVPTLQRVVQAIAQLQGELRIAHLQAHVDMKRILSLDQIAQYDVLRGYGASGQADAPSARQHGKH